MSDEVRRSRHSDITSDQIAAPPSRGHGYPYGDADRPLASDVEEDALPGSAAQCSESTLGGRFAYATAADRTTRETVAQSTNRFASQQQQTVIRPVATSAHSSESESLLQKENEMLRSTNRQQAEKIVRLTKENERLRQSGVGHTTEELHAELELERLKSATYKEDFENERRDKERALAEKDSLMKQTTALLSDLKASQERNVDLEETLRHARHYGSPTTD